MQEGTVKFFHPEKGFGFIKPENSNEDIFVHASGLVDKIEQSDKVVFDTMTSKKGLVAIKVKKIRII
ncbi:cold-shock protein [Edaphocola flava]|uniref:cold-shock protein n=1 Tax=Edaphocola flava TaxID=2499629 RepID=UPI00100B9841|nr:cold shock domain-containing protein [Edaphocola flava]